MANRNDPGADAREAAVDAAKAQKRAEETANAALEDSARKLAETSSDAQFSTGEPNPDSNPLGLRPAPGPSYLEYPGKASEEK